MKSIFVPLLKSVACVGAAALVPVTGGASALAAGSLLGIGAYNGLKSTGNVIRELDGEEPGEIYVTYFNFGATSGESSLLGAMANTIPDTPLEYFSYKSGTKLSHACLRIVGEDGWDTLIEISGTNDGDQVLDEKYHSGGLISGSSGGDTLYLLIKQRSNSWCRNNCISKTTWGQKTRSMDSIKTKAVEIFSRFRYDPISSNCQDFARELAYFSKS